jgi:hypothetical protein
MKQFKSSKVLLLSCILLMTFAFFGFNLIQAQMRLTAKPPGVGKPPAITCIDDGMCTSDEYDANVSHESQPCPNYLPLNIYPDPLVQIIGGNGDIDKAFLFQFDGGRIKDTWASNKIDGGFGPIYQDIGDVDGDGEKEIIVVINGSFKLKKYVFYSRRIIMYENGSDGDPSYDSGSFGSFDEYIKYIAIGDVNNDGIDELVLDDRRVIEVYSWNGSAFELSWSSPQYDFYAFRVDIGDADNDGENELILAMFDIGAPIIWNFDINFIGEETIAEPIDVLNPEIAILGIDSARPRDADNDGFAEIIAGGNNNRLMIWKYMWDAILGTFRYKSVFISDDLGGFTQGVDAGDVDGDGQNEVIVGTYATNGDSRIYIFELVLVNPDPENLAYDLVMENVLVHDYVGELSVGDIDNDLRDEIVISGMDIYEYVGAVLEKTYTSIYGDFAIKVR